ncbi:hypothetical protein BJ742DRAFT_787445 [Cladochytrium replicatum]|nr:hypothetical protein BJ742DRAFT_787445 [Cladochytrium replicatum]
MAAVSVVEASDPKQRLFQWTLDRSLPVHTSSSTHQVWHASLFFRTYWVFSIFLNLLVLSTLVSYNSTAVNRIYFGKEYVNVVLNPFLYITVDPLTTLLTVMISFVLLVDQPLLSSFIILLLTSATRTIIGYLLSRGTGFAIPRLFFPDSVYEESPGIFIFLWTLIPLSWAKQSTPVLQFKWGERLAALKMSSGVVTTLLAAQVLVYPLRWSILCGTLLSILKMIGRKRSAFKPWAIYVLCSLLLSGFSTLYHGTSLPLPAENDLISMSSAHDCLMTFLVMTAPRRSSPKHLIATVESFLNAFPKTIDGDPTPLSKHLKVVVYTRFSTHPVFDEYRKQMQSNTSFSQYVDFIQHDGTIYAQKDHLSKALVEVRSKYDSKYYTILEDDFPLCDGGWDSMLRLLRFAQGYDHCGLFVGTGGSGILMDAFAADTVSSLLMSPTYYEVPADLVMQRCVRGVLDECAQCKMVISPRLLMRHIGFNTSTWENRVYGEERWQCGWRHPFHGEVDVIVPNTDFPFHG